MDVEIRSYAPRKNVATLPGSGELTRATSRQARTVCAAAGSMSQFAKMNMYIVCLLEGALGRLGEEPPERSRRDDRAVLALVRGGARDSREDGENPSHWYAPLRRLKYAHATVRHSVTLASLLHVSRRLRARQLGAREPFGDVFGRGVAHVCLQLRMDVEMRLEEIMRPLAKLICCKFRNWR